MKVKDIMTGEPRTFERSLNVVVRKAHRVRRLPVEGFSGTVVGIISMNDIVLASGPRKPVRDTEVVSALQAIGAHRHPSPHIAAA